MKKLSILALAAVGLLFGACSSNDAIDEPKNPLTEDGQGFFKLNLNLPSNVATSTRADGWGEAEVGHLDDGLTKEYDVESVLLLIFDGASESAATLVQAITPTEYTTASPADDPNQITTKKEYIAELKNAPTANLYALAIVNGSGIVEAGTTSDTKVKIAGGAEVSGITLADLQAAVSVPFINSNKFFMTNAVLSKSRGGASNPGASPALQILSPIIPEYIYETETAAQAGVAATDIYVERGVAKVTVNSTALAAAALKTKGGATVTPSLVGWVIDNTEPSSYIVRKVPTTFTWNLKSKEAITNDAYRFVGGNAVDKFYGTEKLFRTYWAEDPQYTTDPAVLTTSTSPTFKAGTGDENPQYCYENTFPVAQQKHYNTTRVLIKVNLSASGFYTIGADRKTLYTLDNVKDVIKTDLMNQMTFSTWWGTQSTGTLTGADLTVVWSSDDAGVITVTDVTINKSKCDKTTPASDPSVNTALPAVITALNTQLDKVDYFKGGDVYYQIRIKHFGDDLTPWKSAEYDTSDPDYAPKESSIANIYPQGSDSRQEENYLGRYGMVRNNWYDLELGQILKVGNSTVPSLTGDDHPDDELDELYIKARINILSWAKRTQKWTLK